MIKKIFLSPPPTNFRKIFEVLREKEGSIFPKTHPPFFQRPTPFLRKLQVFGHFGRKFLSELSKKADFCEKNVHFAGPLDDDSPARGTSEIYEAV